MTWTLYYAVFVLGLAALLGTPRRGAAPAVALVAFWAVWFVGRPVWTSWWLVGAPVHREQRALLACALVSLGVLFLTRGTRSGARSLRALWLAVTASTGAMGVWEVVTRQHYPLAAPYAPPDFSPSGPFGNPNNFAAVLLVGFGLTVLWATERVRTRVRVGLGALAATYAVLVVLTLSRLALVAMLVLAVLPLLLRWQRHGGPTRLRQRCDRRPRAAAAATVLAGTALLAAFVVPALARVNPVLRVLFPGDDETTRADGLRRNLIEAGLRFWADDPVRGIGGGRFEILLRRQRPDIGVVTNMHNGFVELLVEYGLLLSVPLAVVLAVLLVGIVSPAGRTGRGSAGAGTPAAARTPEGDAGGGRPALARYAGAPAHLDDLGARYLIVVLLVAFGVAGVVTSSPLQWFMWWLMLASAVGLAWAHRAQISPRRPERS